jgi:hypothetical protein
MLCNFNKRKINGREVFMTDVQSREQTVENTTETWDKLMAKLDEITEKLRRAREEAEAFLKQSAGESEKSQSPGESPSQNG